MLVWLHFHTLKTTQTILISAAQTWRLFNSFSCVCLWLPTQESNRIFSRTSQMTHRSPAKARSPFWHAHQVGHASSECKLLKTLVWDIQHFFLEFKLLGFNTFLIAVTGEGSCRKKTFVAVDFWIASSSCLFPYLCQTPGSPPPAVTQCQQPHCHPSPTSHLYPLKGPHHHRVFSCSVCRSVAWYDLHGIPWLWFAKVIWSSSFCFNRSSVIRCFSVCGAPVCGALVCGSSKPLPPPQLWVWESLLFQALRNHSWMVAWDISVSAGTVRCLVFISGWWNQKEVHLQRARKVVLLGVVMHISNPSSEGVQAGWSCEIETSLLHTVSSGSQEAKQTTHEKQSNVLASLQEGGHNGNKYFGFESHVICCILSTLPLQQECMNHPGGSVSSKLHL